MPNWNHIVREQLAVLRLSPEREGEIVEELGLHLEAIYEDALADGSSEKEAEARAVQSYDWRLLECELSRVETPLLTRKLQPSIELIERKGGMRMGSFIQDLGFGWRLLVKQPGFALMVVLTLALGIGANSTMFSFFNGILLRPLPYPQWERLVLLDEIATKRGGGSLGVSFTNYLDWRAQNQVFAEVGGYHSITFTLTGVGDAEELNGAMASHGLFKLLGVAPLRGRAFTPEEDKAGGGRVVMLGYGVWQRRFGGDPNIVGRTVTFGKGAWEVVGVMPSDFKFPAGAEFWIPLTLNTKGWPRTMHGMGALARLKPEVTLAQAQSEMDNIARSLAEQYPASNEGIEVNVTGLRDHLVKDYQRGLWMLLGVVGFVLLIACANVTNLLLAQATVRQREMALRAALGAGRWRIVRQVLCESLLLGALGGVVGMLLAWLGLDWLLTVLPTELPYWMKFKLDGRVLMFTLAVSLLTSLIFGAAPAWQAAHVDVYDALKEGGRSGTSRQGLRHLLVVAQVALALILLVGAGLMMRSFLRLQHLSLGFNPDNLLTLRVTVPGNVPLAHQLLARVNALPGVTSAGTIAALPLTGIDDKWGIGLVAENETGLSLQQAPRISLGIITPQYFRAMEIPLLAGRAFDDSDTQATPDVAIPKVAIIDEQLARAHWPNANPLGQRIRIGQADDRADWHTIVGVAGAVQHDRPEVATRPTVYVPNLQKAGPQTLVIRSSLPPEALLVAIKNVVKEIDANLPITHVAMMSEVIAESIWQPRLYAVLFAVFAVVALLLAAVGIYGVMAYAVAARTNEIGIRMALGAQPRDLLRLVVGQGMLLVFSGIGLGLLGASLLTRLLKTFLFGVSATDPLTFAGVALLLTLVALFACWIPAQRATKTDPLIALRCE